MAARWLQPPRFERDMLSEIRTSIRKVPDVIALFNLPEHAAACSANEKTASRRLRSRAKHSLVHHLKEAQRFDGGWA